MAEDKKYNVLIVDDEKDLRKTVGSMCSSFGYNPFTAGDGEEALDIIETNIGIDLVVTDVNMPKMGGQALSQKIYEEAVNGNEKYKMPIMVMSGLPNEEEARRAVDYAKKMLDFLDIKGIQPLIDKPFDIDVLKEKLEDFLSYKNIQPNPQPASV